MPLDQQYLESLYWAVSVTTGLGNDIVAGNATEVLFTSVIVVFGLIIYSILLGSSTSALQNKDSAAADKRNKLDRVGDYLRYRKVPVFFQKVTIEYDFVKSLRVVMRMNHNTKTTVFISNCATHMRIISQVVLDYYEHLLSSSKSSNTEQEVLHELPATLRVRLSLMLKRELMLRVPFFSHFHVDLFI